ncbi:DUF3093 family protein [Streptomyces sp. NPDC059092]|uniref:DUF3093 family protein n=1 Tax=Streptomyces sp. NPDC059092 TaxID=3346725 RepID=UPI00367D08C6
MCRAHRPSSSTENVSPRHPRRSSKRSSATGCRDRDGGRTRTPRSRTIGHAVEELEVPDIIVCGHSHCGLVEAGLRTGPAEDADGRPSPDAYDKVTTVTSSKPPVFDERPTAPKTWWAIAALFGLAFALVFLPYGGAASFIGLLAGAGLAGLFVSKQGSVRIRVTHDLLVVDDARVPLATLGAATVLTGEDARAWRTYKADPRAFMVMRGYITTAVRVENIDPEDPTPYLYLSTRAPERPAEAIGIRD